MANNKKVKAIPEGYHTLTPYLVVTPAAEAIEFYKKAFGFKELNRSAGPDGKIMHAALQLGDSKLLLCDELPGMTGGTRSPKSLGSTTVNLWLYVEDVDAVFNRAVQAGAK